MAQSVSDNGGDPEAAKDADRCAISERYPTPATLPSIGPEAAASLAPPPVERPSVDGADLAGAFASNTKRAYAADWRSWKAWCADHGVVPMPAPPAEVADYVKARIAAGAALSSLRRAVAAIATAHKIAGRAFDRTDPALHFAMRRLARELGTAPKHAKAAISTAEITAMLPKGGALLAIRDRALLLLDFAGGFRRSELVGIDVEHIEWRRDGIVVLLPRSKTDQEGAGQRVGILYGRRERTCPVRTLKAWLEASAIATGPVFREVRGSRVSEGRLDDEAVARAVKRHGAAAGLDPTRLAGHSLRAGHVTEALQRGADPIKAKEQLRHKKLDTTLGYNRAGATLGSGNTSGKLGL
jgi:integrase